MPEQRENSDRGGRGQKEEKQHVLWTESAVSAKTERKYEPGEAADYAVITIRKPFQAAFDRSPHGYQRILEYLKSNSFKENRKAEFLSCFEWVYEKDGVPYMNVYIHTDGGKKTNPAAGLW